MPWIKTNKLKELTKNRRKITMQQLFIVRKKRSLKKVGKTRVDPLHTFHANYIMIFSSIITDFNVQIS